MPARRLRRGRKVVSPRPSGHDFAPAPAGTAAKPARACAFAAFVWIWNNRQGQPTPRLHLRIARWLADRWEAASPMTAERTVEQYRALLAESR